MNSLLFSYPNNTAATELMEARRNGFMPTVGEIIEVIQQVEVQRHTLSPEEIAEIHAEIVMEFFSRYSRTRYPKFNDSLINYLMANR